MQSTKYQHANILRKALNNNEANLGRGPKKQGAEKELHVE